MKQKINIKNENMFKKKIDFLKFFYSNLESKKFYKLNLKKFYDNNNTETFYLTKFSLESLNFLNDYNNIYFKKKEEIISIFISNLLFKQEEYEILQNYCQYLIEDIPILKFYLGLCYLKEGKILKCKEYFKNSSIYFLKKNEFNLKILKYFENINNNNNNNNNNILISYYKILLEILNEHPDLILFFSKFLLKELIILNNDNDNDDEIVKKKNI
jgi:hypothetical protein